MPVRKSEEVFEVRVEGRINFLLLVCEAHKVGLFTKQELVNLLIDFVSTVNMDHKRKLYVTLEESQSKKVKLQRQM